MSRRIAIAACCLFLLSGCARKKVRVAAKPISRPAGYTETGIASWYGHPYHGRAAANGEIYDMEKLTAAHRTLPFSTWVRVENLNNSKSVDVRITDRGPFIDGRIIDLSRAAARSIDMLGPGIIRVKMTVIAAPSVLKEGIFAVQVGAFRDRNNAERLRKQMEQEHGIARLVMREGQTPVWRVLVGNEPSEQAAGDLAGRIRNRSVKAAFVVRMD